MNLLDTSVTIHGHRAGTPLGPAPGNLTTNPENILECYKNGARVFEIRAEHLAAAIAGRRIIEDAGGADFIFDLNVNANPFDLPREHPFHCATIFCFHQGPAERIERAARDLIDKHALPVSLKFSPIMLGNDELIYLLHERLGLRRLELGARVWENEITFDDAIALVHRLPGVAVKFSNVLEVVDRTSNQDMYLAGAPLHVIALRLAEKWRQNFGLSRPIGFSAGVNADNFADCVACGFAPITASTDLLQPGGPNRLRHYLQSLLLRMQDASATNINEFILQAHNNTALAHRHRDPVSYAALLNTGTIWSRTIANPRYDFSTTELTPQQIGSRFWLSA